MSDEFVSVLFPLKEKNEIYFGTKPSSCEPYQQPIAEFREGAVSAAIAWAGRVYIKEIQEK